MLQPKLLLAHFTAPHILIDISAIGHVAFNVDTFTASNYTIGDSGLRADVGGWYQNGFLMCSSTLDTSCKHFELGTAIWNDVEAIPSTHRAPAVQEIMGQVWFITGIGEQNNLLD